MKVMPADLMHIFVNFIIGGVTVAAISLVGTFLNPLLAAIVWAYPSTVVPSIGFMKSRGKSNKYIAEFLFSATVAMSLLLVAMMALGYFVKNTPDSVSLWKPIGQATLSFIAASVVFYLGIREFGLIKYFM
jgi:predicted PurR-regulated permease PerM